MHPLPTADLVLDRLPARDDMGAICKFARTFSKRVVYDICELEPSVWDEELSKQGLVDRLRYELAMTIGFSDWWNVPGEQVRSRLDTMASIREILTLAPIGWCTWCFQATWHPVTLRCRRCNEPGPGLPNNNLFRWAEYRPHFPQECDGRSPNWCLQELIGGELPGSVRG